MDVGPVYRAHRRWRTQRKMDDLSTSTLTLWMDPARNCLNSSGVQCVSGEAVNNWTNRPESLGTRTFTQATAGSRPVFYQNERFPYVRFDGTDDYLSVANSVWSSATGTMFVVARMLGSATRTMLCTSDEGAGAGTTLWALLDHATPAWRIRKDATQATDDLSAIIEAKAAQRNVPIVARIRDDASAWSCKVAGVTQTISVVTGVNAGSQMPGSVAGRDNFTIGCLFDAGGASSFCNFDLYELIFLEGANTADELATVDNYLKQKYRYRSVAHLGDSWAADTGYGIELRSILAPRFIHVHDHGVGSETMSQIGARWDSDVEGKGYECLILEGGINDLKAVSAGGHEAVFTEARRVALEAVTDGCKVVVCTCGPFGNNSGWTATRERETQLYNEKIRNLCANRGLVLCDLYAHAVNPDGGVRSPVLNNSGSGQNCAFRPSWELSGGLHYNAGGDVFAAQLVAGCVEQALNSQANMF